MDTNLGLFKFLAPQIPGLLSAAAWHTVGMTETSSKWDLRSTLTIQVLRNMMSGNGNGGKPPSIAKVQATTLKDPGIKGKIWVAKATVRAPKPSDESLREAVFQAIDDMKDGDITYTRPDLADTEVEWTGFRADAGKNEVLPECSEEEKYKRMMSEPTRTSSTTILYFHGGAYYLCDPATHRTLCSRLAKESHGRVLSARYRLAPKAAFPAQLLDAFMLYLSLLYPPPGSMHEATAARDIVLAGDSAGGNLSFALLQLILQLHRTTQNPTVKFHGATVAVPLPAGVTANSGWFDISRAMPSLLSNAKYDYLPPPKSDDTLSKFPADAIWPATPPRGDLFCDLTLLDHPLVSPLAAESWEGAPPLWLCTGEEMLTDEDCVVTVRATSQGVKVQFEQYEAMPHCFAMLIPSLATADRCMRSWGDFCQRCVEEPASVQTKGTFVHAKTGKEDDVDVSKVTSLTLEEAKALMREAKIKRLSGYENEGKAMPKPSL